MQQCEVFSGETLVSISIREKVSVNALRRLNKLYGNEIFPGQILTLRVSPKIPEIPLISKIPNDLSSCELKITSSSSVRGVSDHQKGVSAENISDDNRNARAIIPEKLSGIAKNVRLSIASSLDTKQASMRSLVNSIKVPIVDNGSSGRLRSSSAASIAALSVSFTDKKAYQQNDNNSAPPLLLGDSGILTVHHAKQLRDFLPSMQQIENWRLLYSVLNDGADLQSFFRKSKNHKYTILIARTMNGEIFGGFNSVEWSKSSTNFCKYWPRKSDHFICTYRFPFIFMTWNELSSGITIIMFFYFDGTFEQTPTLLAVKI